MTDFSRPPSPPVPALRALVLTLGLAALGFVTGCELAGPDEQSEGSPPPPLTATQTQVVETDTRFGLKLLRSTVAADYEQAGAPTNVFLSPLSVSMALGMTLNGARGETRTAMEAALEKQDLSPAEINDAYRTLIDRLEGLDPAVEVALANSIWYRKTLPVRQAFIDTNRVHFDAEVAGLDFSSPGASDRINDWVADETRGNIEKIVPSAIPPEIVMYLINATYFKGAWQTPFDPDATTDEAFHLPDGSTVSVPMMKRTEDVRPPYLRTDQFTAVDLAYGDSLYSMTVLLPHEDTSIREVVDSLDAEEWARVTDQMRPRTLRSLQMPRFTLRYEKTLNSILADLGMGVAFTDRANFRDIADTSLAISKVKHRTFLRVNEEGTEASGVTSVGVGVTSSVPPSVVVDRPFVVALRENRSNTLLFLGTVVNPAAG